MHGNLLLERVGSGVRALVVEIMAMWCNVLNHVRFSVCTYVCVFLVAVASSSQLHVCLHVIIVKSFAFHSILIIRPWGLWKCKCMPQRRCTMIHCHASYAVLAIMASSQVIWNVTSSTSTNFLWPGSHVERLIAVESL